MRRPKRKRVFRVPSMHERDAWLYKAGALIQTPSKKGGPTSNGVEGGNAQSPNWMKMVAGSSLKTEGYHQNIRTLTALIV